jgi:hypothetical protein
MGLWTPVPNRYSAYPFVTCSSGDWPRGIHDPAATGAVASGSFPWFFANIGNLAVEDDRGLAYKLISLNMTGWKRFNRPTEVAMFTNRVRTSISFNYDH